MLFARRGCRGSAEGKDVRWDLLGLGGGRIGWVWSYLEVWGEHAGCDDEVAEDEAGHAEGKEDGFACVCDVSDLEFNSDVLFCS